MKKNTIDIINRAKELADLQNSDFIGIRENTSLLNEAYTKLYTELINHNDRYYVKTLTVDELELVQVKEKEVIFKLPEDFYMLCNISSGVNCEQVLKKAFSESKTYKRYDIINNNLHLYGGVEQEDLEICYYPTPEYLTLKVPDKSITLPEGWTWCDCYDNKYVGYKWDADTEETDVIIYNIKTQSERSFRLGGIKNTRAPLYIQMGKNGFVMNCYGVLDEEESTGTFYKFVNYNSEKFTDIRKVETSPYGITIQNGSVWLYIGAFDDRGSVISFSNIDNYILSDFTDLPTEEDLTVFVSDIDIRDSISLNSLATMYYLNDKMYIVHSDNEGNWIAELTKTNINIHYKKIDGILDMFNIIYNFPTIINDDLYYLNNRNIYKNDEIFASLEDYKNLVGINKIDINTGYGYTVIDYNGNYIVKSIAEDTEIEFPNNFYYQYLSYMLAIAYKSKQNADATMLQEQANNESAQFYNTVNRDASRNVRINNVYGGGWF